MPRLPMIRGIGSQSISTSSPVAWGATAWRVLGMRLLLRWLTLAAGQVARVVSAGERGAVVPPFRLAVGGGVGDPAQAADELAVGLNEDRGQAAAWRRVHERHE